MDEFSLLMWLLWISNRIADFVSYFLYFQDNHSCDENQNKVTSSKIPDEVILNFWSTERGWKSFKFPVVFRSRTFLKVRTTKLSMQSRCMWWRSAVGCALSKHSVGSRALVARPGWVTLCFDYFVHRKRIYVCMRESWWHHRSFSEWGGRGWCVRLLSHVILLSDVNTLGEIVDTDGKISIAVCIGFANRFNVVTI